MTDEFGTHGLTNAVHEGVIVVDVKTSWWSQRPLPLRIGIVFAALGIALAVVGIARGAVPLNPLSILLALLISAGGWGIVSWAVATAAVDVERDVAEEVNEEKHEEGERHEGS